MTADEAMKALVKAQKAFDEAKTKLGLATIVALDSGNTTVEIAVVRRMTPTNVRNIAVKYGKTGDFPEEGSGNSLGPRETTVIKNNLIRRMYREGKTITEISKIVKSKPAYVTRVLTKSTD